MADITAAMVKELRDKTQAGMMEAKKLLTEAEGDMDAAIRLFREKNAKRAVKEGRTSAEGVVEALVREHNKLGVLVEINSETDFVARNEEFVALARDMAKHAAENPGAATRGRAAGSDAHRDRPARQAAHSGRVRQDAREHHLQALRGLSDRERHGGRLHPYGRPDRRPGRADRRRHGNQDTGPRSRHAHRRRQAEVS